MAHPATPRRRGAPKGATRNPEGKNQYENDRAEKPFSFRLPLWLDEEIRQYLAAEKMGTTKFWEQLAKDWVESRKPRA